MRPHNCGMALANPNGPKCQVPGCEETIDRLEGDWQCFHHGGTLARVALARAAGEGTPA